MNPFIAVAIIAAAVVVAIPLMLVIRRFAAPPGGFFTDSDRAAGVLAVIGTGFAVLLAFVIFLAFSSYDRAREKASVEALATSELFRTAALFAPATQRRLQGELICYARAVVGDEWKTMRDERESPIVDGWLRRTDRSLDAIRLGSREEEAAYNHWFDQDTVRREGRRGRLAEAAPFVPSLIWLALLLGGALIIAYMCFYGDPAEPAFVQAMMMGAVTAMVVAGILVVRFLDRPYENASGSIKPTAMTAALRRMEQQSAASSRATRTPCDARGRSLAANA